MADSELNTYIGIEVVSGEKEEEVTACLEFNISFEVFLIAFFLSKVGICTEEKELEKY